MPTQVILLERVEKLGELGDVVNVKPGYARNYLLPQKKALRASKSNIAFFEAQKKHLEADNEKQKKEAEKTAKKIEGATVDLIRAASESGQLYGSVNSRDIANGLSEKTGEAIARSQVKVNQNYKLIGLFPVDVQLHPEVVVEVTINIARSAEEAETQAKTGKALIAEAEETVEQVMAEAEAELEEEALAEVLEEGALEAEKERKAEAAEEAAAEAKKAEERAAKKAEKDAAKAAEEASEEASAEDEAEAEEDKA